VSITKPVSIETEINKPQNINLCDTTSENEKTSDISNVTTNDVANDTNETPSYKKWHILKLRQKLNFLRMNDRGERSELINRLDEY